MDIRIDHTLRAVKVWQFHVHVRIIFGSTNASKAIEIDRRYSKTLPRLELDPVLTDRILGLVLESDIAEGARALITSPNFH